MKLSDYVAQYLADIGVKHVFMLPGGFAMHLNDSLNHHPDITCVANYHEQACAVAAEAYSRVSGDLGVALVTAGPGSTNAVTGVAGAWLDSTPCLFLSGQVKRADLKGDSGVRQIGVQEIDIVSMVAGITKYAVTVTDPLAIRAHLDEAIYLARSGRPGPVWLDLPLDVQAAQIEPAELRSFLPPPVDDRSAAVNEAADRTVELLEGAERPVLLVGNGVRVAGAAEVLLQLVDRIKAPVLTTRLGVDLVPGDHPLLVGMPGSIAARGSNFTLQNADLLICLGTRLDLALVAFDYQRLARGAKKVVVNIDPAEIRKISTGIDVPVAADVGEFMCAVLRVVDGADLPDWSGWRARCADWKARYPFVTDAQRNRMDGVSMYAFSDALSAVLTGDEVVLPGSSGFAAEIFLTAFTARRGQRVFHNKGTGAMGLCQPSAVGACLASGGRRTVCVDGDGGFQMNVQELETVRRLGLPIKLFVVDNDGYASIRSSQQGYFRRLSCADGRSGLTLPDYVSVAAAYGLRAVRITAPAELAAGIDEALAGEDPVVCVVRTIPDEPREPRVASYQKPDGSMASKPLEDMFPFLDRDEFRANMIVPPVEE